MKKSTDFKKSVLLVVIGVALFAVLNNFNAVYTAVMSVLGVFSPLLAGGMIAFVLNVPMKSIEKGLTKARHRIDGKEISHLRIYSVVLTYAGLLAVLYFIGSVVIPNTADSFKNISQAIRDNYPIWIEWLKQKGLDVNSIEKYIGNIDLETISRKIMDHGRETLSILSGSLGSVIGTVGTFLIGFIFSIYILLAKEKLGRQAKMLTYAYVKKEWADKLCDLAKLSHRTFSNFISGQCLEAVIIGSMFAAALLIAKLPYAATIGIVIGATSLVPIIGAFIGCIFGLILVITVSMKKAIVFIIIFFAIQQFEGHVIYPNVVGKSVGLPAIWTMLAVIVGAAFGGILGIMLFIPMFSVIYELLKKDVYSRISPINNNKE